MLNISLISSSFWHVKIVHFLCSNFQVFAGIFTRCPTCQRAHIYHFCSFCIRCHICHFPIAIWSQNLGIGTIFEPNLPLKTGCNKFQMESVKMKKATKTVAFRQLAIYCNIVDNQLLTDAKMLVICMSVSWVVLEWYLSHDFIVGNRSLSSCKSAYYVLYKCCFLLFSQVTYQCRSA